MTTNKAIILNFIDSLDGKAICDDCLSDKVGITPRQQVNQICHDLQASQSITRNDKVDCQFCYSRKIVNIGLKVTQLAVESPTAFEVFKVALETRNMEIALFWQRSNYFLALNTVIAAGFFSKTSTGSDTSSSHNILLALLGMVVSILWIAVNSGSKFWQSRWEQRLKIAERRLPQEIDFFAADWPIIREDVKQSLNFSNHNKFRQQFDKVVLFKPSVSFAMILLSTAFALFWLWLFLTAL